MKRWLKRGLCLGVMLVVTFICSLPRAVQADASGMVSIQAPFSTRQPHRLDLRLMQIRKFRRRKTSFFFQSHLDTSFLSSPDLNQAKHFLLQVLTLEGRIPDPLVHPPA